MPSCGTEWILNGILNKVALWLDNKEAVNTPTAQTFWRRFT
jgi:hypothetical protein